MTRATRSIAAKHIVLCKRWCALASRLCAALQCLLPLHSSVSRWTGSCSSSTELRPDGCYDGTCNADTCCKATCESVAEAACDQGQRLKADTTCDPSCDIGDCCPSSDFCCEDIPTVEDRCGPPPPGEEAGYAAQFCWGEGGFDGSACPAGFESRHEGDCHRDGSAATVDGCCSASCGSLQGQTCPQGETMRPHNRVYGPSNFDDHCCVKMCSDG